MSVRPSSFFLTRCLRYHYAVRSASSSTLVLPEPPMVARLRSDLKRAMQEKDTVRLDVIRGIIADITNASKVDKLVTSDGQIFAILRRRIHSSTQAINSSVAANRSDITQKEQAQCAILQEYIDDADIPKDEDIQSAVAETIQKLQKDGEKLHMGSVMRALIKHGGPFWGKPLQMNEVARVVRTAISRPRE